MESQRVEPVRRSEIVSGETRANRTTSGFRLKQRVREAGIDPWWQTVTHYMPEPWLIALKNRQAEGRA